MDEKYNEEIKKLLSEIRECENKIETKQRYNNDASDLIETVNRKTKLVEILMWKA